jgi:hypothetical protein
LLLLLSACFSARFCSSLAADSRSARTCTAATHQHMTIKFMSCLMAAQHQLLMRAALRSYTHNAQLAAGCMPLLWLVMLWSPHVHLSASDCPSLSCCFVLPRRRGRPATQVLSP